MRFHFPLTTILLAFSIVFLLTACGKPRVELAVASQANVNPDNSGRPSPIIMKVFELRGDLAFKQNDFYSLFNEPVKALGNELVAADELVFIPSEAKIISYEPMPATNFIGIVAGFRQIERAKWRAIVPINPEEKSIIHMELRDTHLTLIQDKDWDPEKNLQKSYYTENSSGTQNSFDADRRSTNEQSQVDVEEQAKENSAPEEQQGYLLPRSQRTQ